MPFARRPTFVGRSGVEHHGSNATARATPIQPPAPVQEAASDGGPAPCLPMGRESCTPYMRTGLVMTSRRLLPSLLLALLVACGTETEPSAPNPGGDPGSGGDGAGADEVRAT